MNIFKRVIKTNLPIKENRDKNDKFNSYKIILGKNINNNCFKNNITHDIYSQLFFYLNNQQWDDMIQTDTKHYYFNDLQLIINSFGHQCCKKEKIFSYSDFQNDNQDFRLMISRYIPIPPIYFPSSTEYHDMRKIKKIRYIRDNITYELLIISNNNKSVTYEFNIFSSVCNLDSLLEQLFILLKSIENIVKIEHRKTRILENNDFNKLSLSILL